MHDPIIIFDDGSRLVFIAEEHPDGAFYGVCALLIKGGETK